MCDRTLKSTITFLQAHCPSPSSTCSSIPTVSSSSLSPSLPFLLLLFSPLIFSSSHPLPFSSSFPPLSLLFPSSFPPLLLLLSLSCPSPSNFLSSLSFQSSKFESCFSSPHVSDFPEWQKVSLSSPPPREAFIPPHLEPRVCVSPSCWQHVCTCTVCQPGY